MHTQVLDLDVPGAMRQLAAAGNPADPGVKFRRAFLELAQAASGQPLATVQRLEALPLSIAREQGWTAMQIAVHSLVASACIGLGRLPDALGRYQQGLDLAKAARAGGDATAAKLAVQLLSNQGAVYIALKNYREGARAFGEGAGLAEAAGDPFQVMEARRMQGFCLEKDGDWAEALRVEREGLAAAEKLDEGLRHHSTLPYLAESLLALVYRAGDKEEYFRTEAKINVLAGPGWRDKLQPPKPGDV
jgi:tetratricopeptide (TPR) repeat protein